MSPIGTTATGRKHITTLTAFSLSKTLSSPDCGECHASCQSACKTSCTVSNQPCSSPTRRLVRQ